MLNAIINEINLSQKLIPDKNADPGNNREIISTLYFGGGTPSLLSNEEIKQLIKALQIHYDFEDNIEITLEANPDDITHSKLQEWGNLGINRLSIGIQSFVEEELSWMNRAHTAKESLHCLDLVKESGFTNYSVDLIYGSPVLTDENWKRNVQTVISKNIPHVSCYALTVEPKTALDKMITLKKKEPTDPEKQASQFLSLMDWMEQAGYEHYEISNFSKPGSRSKHNSSYWLGEYYYAFGPAAHAFDGKTRRWNIANNALYIQSLQQGIIPFEEEILSETQQLNEYIMTSLRMMEGLNLDQVSDRFGENKINRIKEAGKKFVNSGKLLLANQHLILTKEGKLFADGIAADLFF